MKENLSSNAAVAANTNSSINPSKSQDVMNTQNIPNEGKNKGKEGGPTKAKKRTIDPFWDTVNRARKVFKVQLVINNENKFKCLMNETGRYYYDKDKFLNIFVEKANILLDSKRFGKDCEIHKVDPEIFATHVVYLGSATLHRVFKNGLDDPCVSRDIHLYTEAFLPEEVQQRLKV